jgi:hypothetical protein
VDRAIPRAAAAAAGERRYALVARWAAYNHAQTWSCADTETDSIVTSSPCTPRSAAAKPAAKPAAGAPRESAGSHSIHQPMAV